MSERCDLGNNFSVYGVVTYDPARPNCAKNAPTACLEADGHNRRVLAESVSPRTSPKAARDR